MAGDRKENSVLFRLKELKEMTADDPEPSAPRMAAARPTARPTNNFIDDADALLADIRDAVGEDANAEAARRDAEKRRQQEQAAQAILATQTASRAEIETRLAAEAARRAAAEDERRARAQAIDLAERRARGEIIEEPEPARPVFVAAPQPALLSLPQEPLPNGRGNLFYLVMVGLPVLCITAVAIALILKPAEPPPAPIVAPTPPPAAVVVAPEEPPTRAAVVPETAEEEEDGGPPDAAVRPDAAPRVAKRRKKHRRGKATRKKPKRATKPKGEELKLNLGGGDGITF